MAKYQYTDTVQSEETLVNICPLTKAQDKIAGRWKIVIISHLDEKKVIRFNELLRMIPGVSKGILTRQLRELEKDGVVHREVYREVPPKVEYSLTDQGKQFKPVLKTMREWGSNFVEKE